MARTEKTRIMYETLLCDGPRENNLQGVILNPDDPDEPFRIQLQRITEVTVTDGRGKNWQESGRTSEKIADLSLEQAGRLAQALINDIAWAAQAAERRVLIPEPKEEA